tara:strand:- start:828 stop:1085 length:258 start_codon:yes stop_codon:yes gene_type:complete
MPEITITITDTEQKSLEYAAYSVQDWADNAIKNRARKAKDQIIGLLVTHCNNNSIALAVGEDAQVTQAFDLGIVQTAVDREEALK